MLSQITRLSRNRLYTLPVYRENKIYLDHLFLLLNILTSNLFRKENFNFFVAAEGVKNAIDPLEDLLILSLVKTVLNNLIINSSSDLCFKLAKYFKHLILVLVLC